MNHDAFESRRDGSNKRCKVAQRFSHGTVRTKFVNGHKETIIVDIENFVNIPTTTTSFCITNIQACGHEWKVRIFPREGFSRCRRVLIFLRCADKRIEAGSLIANARFRTKAIIGSFLKNSRSVSMQRRQIIEDGLNDDGTFTFEFDIEIAKRAVWYPKLNTLNNDIGTKLYRSIEATSDVTFLVGLPEMKIKAHKSVLFLRARELYDLVITEEHSLPLSRNGTEIVLENIDSSAFEALVQFCYIGTIPKLNTKGNKDENEAKNVLLVADRFGCSDLKLYTESYLVEHILVASKVARLLLLADSHSCPLLKEASMHAFIVDPKTVMESQGDWKKIQESTKLLEELLVHATSGRSNVKYSSVVTDGDGTVNYADGLDVTSLRERLQKYQLDVDGSKETLLHRWKDHCGSKNH